MEKAVVRLSVYDTGKFQILTSTPPMDMRNILDAASEIAQTYGLHHAIVDAILNRPDKPLCEMHSWWNKPNKVIDVRPIEHVSALRCYHLTQNDEVASFRLDREIRAHDPIQDLPMAPTAYLFPYEHETYFAGRG